MIQGKGDNMDPDVRLMLDSLIRDIQDMVLLVDLHGGFDEVPDDQREEFLGKEVVRDLAFLLTGVGSPLTHALLTSYTPDLLFSLSHPVTRRLEEEELEFTYMVKEDRLIGKVKHRQSGIFIAAPISQKIVGLANKLIPYQLTVGSIH